MITVRTSKGTFTGRDTIEALEQGFGKPVGYWGDMVTRRTSYSEWDVLARIIDVEGTVTEADQIALGQKRWQEAEDTAQAEFDAKVKEAARLMGF